MPKNVVCKKCNNLKNAWCEKVIDSPDPDMVRDCRHFWERTNADRIRAMSDEELAQAIYEMVQGSVEGLLEMFDLPARIDSVVRVEPYKKRLLSWLQQPAEEVQ